MSLYRKIVLVVGFLMIIGFALTLSVVYVESRNLIETGAENKAQSVIGTVTAALDANISSYDFQKILQNLSQREPFIQTFDIFGTDGNGYIIASTNVKDIGQQVSQSLQAASAKAEFQTRAEGNLISIGAPIFVNGKLTYYANVVISMGQDLAATQQLLNDIILVGIGAVLFMILMLWLIIPRLVSKPLLAVIKQAQRIAGGKLDVDLGDQERRRDEVGQLAHAFVGMAASLQTLIGGISRAAEELGAASEQLVASSDETAVGAHEVVDVMGHVSQRTERQMAHSQESAASMSKVAKEIEFIVKVSSRAADASLQSYEKAEEGSTALSHVSGQMESIGEITQRSTAANEQLLHRSKEIEQITGEIAQIAQHTNLLALNASIEAARAGEHGKGFAVVASEVNELAETTKHLVEQIAQVVHQIQKDIHESTTLSVTVSDSVQSGLQMLHKTTQTFGGISELVREVADQMRTTSESIQNISEHSRSVLGAINAVADTARVSTGEVAAVSEHAREQLKTIKEVHSFANHLCDMALELQRLIAAFE